LALAGAARGRPYRERPRLLLGRADLVEPPTAPRVVPDGPDDDKLVAAALAAGAALVSHDAHLLAVSGHEALEVVRPADLRPG
jgi:hypothetical protein